MLGLAILLAFQLLGLFLQSTLNLPLPPNVLGMILLTLALSLKIVRLHWIEPAANFLLRHMLLFFVPYLLAITAVLPFLQGNWLAVILGILLSTLATLAITGYIAQKLSPPPAPTSSPILPTPAPPNLSTNQPPI